MFQITKAFYENWSVLDLSKVKKLYKEENKEEPMPILTKQINLETTNRATRHIVEEANNSDFNKMEEEVG